MNSQFTFESGVQVSSPYFATVCEIAHVIYDSDHPVVKEETEKVEKWSNFIQFFIDPVKQRFKDGLLTPNNNGNFLPNIDSRFMGTFEMRNYDEPTQKITQEQPTQSGLPMNDFISKSIREFQAGKKEGIEMKDDKKDIMEIINDDEEDNEQVFVQRESNHEFEDTAKEEDVKVEYFDNNFWDRSISQASFDDVLSDLAD